MAANPLSAAGSVPPATPAPPTAPAAPGGSYVEATGSTNPEYFRSPTLTPTEPPGFLDKLSDTFSPLQKGFEKAQEFAKKNPLMTGIASTIASRMANSGNSMPDTTYKGPLSKYKLKNFKGNFANPQDYQYKRASGGIIDYKEGGTTETPLTHADMGIAIDTDPDTRYLNPLDAAKKRNKKLRDRYGISIPEMQAPTPINDVNVSSAAHGGIMQVKRFDQGADVEGGPDAGPNSGTDAGAGLTGLAQGAFDDDNSFTDYMAVLGSLGIVSQDCAWNVDGHICIQNNDYKLSNCIKQLSAAIKSSVYFLSFIPLLAFTVADI
jgi:hypothetical protein